MILNRLSLAEFLGIVVTHIQEQTGLPCHTTGANNDPPFYFVELISSEPRNTKTMFIDHIETFVHAVAAKTEVLSFAPVLDLVQILEESMTVDVVLPRHFVLVNQQANGLQSLQHDPTGEGHAVLGFGFDICYGFRCK